MGIPISVRLPSSKDVPASINRGVPLVRHSPRHPFSRQMTELASADLVSPGRVDSGGGRSRTRRGLRLLQEARA
jgi:pilus assembly protein CpaE